MSTIFLHESQKKYALVGFPKSEIPLHKGVDNLKYYLIVMYFRKHLQTFGEVTFSLNQLLNECGYSTNTHIQTIYDDFRKIIQEEIIDKGYAVLDGDILSATPKETLLIKFDFYKNIFFATENFVQISVYEYDTIANYRSSRVNKSILMGTLLFIKQFISQDKCDGIYPKISYPSKIQIKDGVGVAANSTVEKAIKILVELKLLYVKNDLFVADYNSETVFVPARNVYALSPSELQDDIVMQELSDFYGRAVCDKENISGKVRYLPRMTKKN